MRLSAGRALAALLILLGVTSQAGAVRRPHVGGTLRVALAEPLATADPAQAMTFADWLLVGMIHAGLYRHADGGVVPDLLDEPLQPLEGERRYAGRLQRDARFHDGAPVTAIDVQRSLARLAGSAWAFAPALITVRVTGTMAFELRLARPVSRVDLERLLASPALSVVRGGRGAVGAGPFRLHRLAATGSEADLRAHLRSHHGRAYLDAVTVAVLPNEEAVVEGFHYGRHDLVFTDSPRYRQARRVVGPFRETLGLLVRQRDTTGTPALRARLAGALPRRLVAQRLRGRTRESVALVPQTEGPALALPRPSGDIPPGTRWFIGGPEWLEGPRRTLAAALGGGGTPWPEQPLDRLAFRQAVREASGRWDAVLVPWYHATATEAGALHAVAALTGATGDPVAALRGSWSWIPIVDRARTAITTPRVHGLEWTAAGTLSVGGASIE